MLKKINGSFRENRKPSSQVEKPANTKSIWLKSIMHIQQVLTKGMGAWVGGSKETFFGSSILSSIQSFFLTDIQCGFKFNSNSISGFPEDMLAFLIP